MLSINNLAKRHGAQTLFADASLTLAAGCRYGVIGANGSGKSTILRIIAGEEEASEGEVNIAGHHKIGWLKQDHFAYEDVRILDVVMMGNAELYAAMKQKEELLANAEHNFDADRYAELEDIVMRHDGYSQEAKAGEMLEGLNIPTVQHDEPMSVLSGGYKLRVLLAQTLCSAPDILLLDEPTNHLDILSIRWMEKFLIQYRGCVLVVSHDRRFLNAVCTHIVDVDYELVSQYKGNYDAFEKAKAEHRARQEAEIAKRKSEIADHKAFIDRFKAKASKARQANSRVKKIQKIVIEELPRSSRRYPKFKFNAVRPSGRRVIEIDKISKRYDENVVLDEVSLTVERGDRLAVIGPNGIGKSTLLKVMMGHVVAEAGTLEWGHETHIGYFGQDHTGLDRGGEETVMSWLWQHVPDQSNGFVRGRLAAVLFGRDDVDKKLRALSGGECARLVFARIGVAQPNVLLLDEPTNHLDFEGIEALADGLENFDGTVIFVSHNRWFVEKLATRIIELRPDGIDDYRGNYREYLDHCGDDHLDVATVVDQARGKKRR
jgi:ATPase subunit of ABC transporter with duplicated ATPase domains